MSTSVGAADGVVALTEEDYTDLFDRIAKKNMGISGAEFLQRWKSGEYEGVDWDAVPGLRPVAMALPLAP